MKIQRKTIDDTGREKLTGEELRMIVLLRIMWGAIDGRFRKVLGARLKKTPRGYMMFCQAFGLLSAMFMQLRETVPERQLEQIDRTVQHGEVQVRLQRAGAYDDDMNIVRSNTLGVAVGYAMRGECALCVKDRADVKRCPLRKAIDELCPPDSYETAGCVYRDLAHDHKYPDIEAEKI